MGCVEDGRQKMIFIRSEITNVLQFILVVLDNSHHRQKKKIARPETIEPDLQLIIFKAFGSVKNNYPNQFLDVFIRQRIFAGTKDRPNPDRVVDKFYSISHFVAKSF